MARVIAATLAALALWLAYCLSGVAWRLLRIARHRPDTAADPVRFGLLGAANWLHCDISGGERRVASPKE